jgi:hypothetical protein
MDIRNHLTSGTRHCRGKLNNANHKFQKALDGSLKPYSPALASVLDNFAVRLNQTPPKRGLEIQNCDIVIVGQTRRNDLF